MFTGVLLVQARGLGIQSPATNAARCDGTHETCEGLERGEDQLCSPLCGTPQAAAQPPEHAAASWQQVVAQPPQGQQQEQADGAEPVGSRGFWGTPGHGRQA